MNATSLIDKERLAAALESLAPAADGRTLVQALAQTTPGLAFQLAHTRNGWYRTGGVVTADGERVADSLRDWAEEASAGDLDDLIADYADAGYLATRLDGATHFLVASLGPGTLDFIQVEVEEIQERLDRPLIDPDNLPDDIEDLIDPMEGARTESRPIGERHYRLRRVTDFSSALHGDQSAFLGDAFFRRFLSDWEASSAAAETRLFDHWVLTLVPYTDRFGEARFYVKPQALSKVTLGQEGDGVLRGGELARFIHGFDREAGYPMAWFFNLVTHGGISHRLAEAVQADLMGAFDYLPVKDLAVLRRWVKDPYQL